MASPVKAALETQVRPRGGGDMEAAPPPAGLFLVDLSLRLVLLSAAAASLAMVLTSDQTHIVYSPLLPAPISMAAKFTYSSAITYSMGTTSAVCLYSILSSASTFLLAKRSPSARLLLLQAFLDAVITSTSLNSYLMHVFFPSLSLILTSITICCPICDAPAGKQLMTAVLASGTGAVSSVAYIALRGNSHVGWHKVCDVFDKFCRHVGSSVALDVAALLVLVALVFTSTYSLYRRAR